MGFCRPAAPYPRLMPLYLRKIHDLRREAYRVVLKDDMGEVEIGSIGPQDEANNVTRWQWAIDTVIL